METLLLLPEPSSWTCEGKDCGRPVDIWVQGPWPEGVDPDSDASLHLHTSELLDGQIRCSGCVIRATPHDRQAQVRGRFEGHREMWRQVGEPPGTLYVIEERIGDVNVASDQDSLRRFTAILYAVEVDTWNPRWSQTFLSGPSGLVFLAAIVTAEGFSEAFWVFRWSPQQPESPPTC